MKQILCTLPNAAEQINGVVFNEHPQGRLSVPIDDDIAEGFMTIEGYTLLDIKPAKPKTE